jgi:mono/diheme cytochrome c family protein
VRPARSEQTITIDRRRHPARVILALIAVLAILAALAFFAFAWHPSIAAVNPPARNAFDPALVRRGQQLASAGDCNSCHSTADGPSYAGGVALQTPFGTIHGTNITPDAQTGIGGWSEAAFRRALREGVSRDGHLLYPAFPYNHFTHLSDADIGALYAFMMTRDPAPAQPVRNQLQFPFQFRPLVAGWNLLYLERGPLPAQANQDAQWARGEYLVRSVGHCGACHTPRTRLGGEDTDHALAGGEAEGWRASALERHSPSPVPWTVDTLSAYLRSGLVADHAVTAGPMQAVVRNLAHVSGADVRAIATYIVSAMGPVTPGRQRREALARQKAQVPLAQVQPAAAAPDADQPALTLGAKVYQESCASCHDAGRQLSSGSALRLPLAVALYLPDPRNLIHIVREGIAPPPGQPGRWMPPFDGILSDEQLTALAVWLRRQASDAPPWQDVARVVKDSGSAP